MAATFLEEAAKLKDLRHDKERVANYVWARQRGVSPETARQICKYGSHFLRCEQAKRLETVDLLNEYGVSGSPLCWPRYELEIPGRLEDCPVLGRGTSNKVYGLSFEGDDYAFRPFTRLSDRDPARSPISWAGEVLGIKKDQFYPELRAIAATRIADSLGMLGSHGIVNPICVALVNGVPGTMTPRIHGRNEGRTNLWNKKIPFTSEESKYLCSAITADTDEKVQQAVRSLGLSMVTVDEEKQEFRFTGTVGKRNDKAQRRFGSPSYNLSMMQLQAFTYLANVADIHPANVMYEQTSGGEWKAKAIDLDEALASIAPADLKFQNSDDAWIMADLSLPPKYLSAGLRAQLESERCIEMNECLREELRTYLPQECLSAFNRREEELRASTLPEFPADEVWQDGDDLRPDLFQLDRAIGMSLHEFGDSDDSDSYDELTLPEAREIG